MNTTCKEAYAIFCESNRSQHYTKVGYILDMLKIYKKKLIIYQVELTALAAYIEHLIGKIKLSEYENFIIICNLSELGINDTIGNRDLWERIFNSVIGFR